MRIARVGPAGQERPVVVADQTAFLAEPVTADFDSRFFESGGLDRLRSALEGGRLPETDIGGLRLGAPVARPGNVLCIGLNYAMHAQETGQPIPSEPVLFLKAPNTVCGPNDEILIPRQSTKTDWEVELAVVIGRRASYLSSPEESLDHVAGYAISNDVSERTFQLERGGQWSKGKSCATFNPLGPWLVTTDEVGAADALDLSLTVNGAVRQQSNTSDMVFGVPYLVWYLSQFLVLDPGDVINTGTPAGVALGRADFEYLKPGDVVELTITGLGSQRQTVGAA